MTDAKLFHSIYFKTKPLIYDKEKYLKHSKSLKSNKKYRQKGKNKRISAGWLKFAKANLESYGVFA